MPIPKHQSENETGPLKLVISFYKKAIENVPALKYSWGVIALACVYSILGYFKYNRNFEIPVKAFLTILGLTFTVFLFAFITRTSDRVVRIALYILTYALILVITALLVSIPVYIFTGNPKFYASYIQSPPHVTNSDSSNINHKTSDSTIFSKKDIKNLLHQKRKAVAKPKLSIISIQLSQKSGGFKRVFIDGLEISTRPESTIFNPRIDINTLNTPLRIAILTNSGDTCVTYISKTIDSSFYRLVPNCN